MYSINVDILSSLFKHRLLFNILLYMYNIHHIRDLFICSDFLQYNYNVIYFYFILQYQCHNCFPSIPGYTGRYRILSCYYKPRVYMEY